jgi:hypothetical protein
VIALAAAKKMLVVFFAANLGNAAHLKLPGII